MQLRKSVYIPVTLCVPDTVHTGGGGAVAPSIIPLTAFKTNLSDEDEPKLLKILKDVSSPPRLWALLQEIQGRRRECM